MVARKILASPSDGTDFTVLGCSSHSRFTVLGCSSHSRSTYTFDINQLAHFAVIAAYTPLKMANRQMQNQ